MELLLLLTAFFASLTGSASADRAGVSQVPGVAVVRAAQVARDAVQPQRVALPHAVAARFARPDRAVLPPLSAAPMPAVRLAFERRLE